MPRRRGLDEFLSLPHTVRSPVRSPVEAMVGLRLSRGLEGLSAFVDDSLFSRKTSSLRLRMEGDLLSACRVACGEVDWYKANFRL